MTSPIEILKKSFEIFFKRENLDYFVKIGLVSLFLNVIFLIPTYMQMFGYQPSGEQMKSFTENPVMIVLTVILSLITVTLAFWSQASNYESVKRVLSNGELDFKQTFKSSWKYLFKFFLANLLLGLITVVGLFLLIIPGIIFGVIYGFTIYALVSGKGIMESLKYSKKLIKDRFWKVFGRMFVFGLFSFVIGIITAFVPYSLGSLVLALFSGLFMLPYFILYKELESSVVND